MTTLHESLIDDVMPEVYSIQATFNSRIEVLVEDPV